MSIFTPTHVSLLSQLSHEYLALAQRGREQPLEWLLHRILIHPHDLPHKWHIQVKLYCSYLLYKRKVASWQCLSYDPLIWKGTYDHSTQVTEACSCSCSHWCCSHWGCSDTVPKVSVDWACAPDSSASEMVACMSWVGLSWSPWQQRFWLAAV